MAIVVRRRWGDCMTLCIIGMFAVRIQWWNTLHLMIYDARISGSWVSIEPFRKVSLLFNIHFIVSNNCYYSYLWSAWWVDRCSRSRIKRTIIDGFIPYYTPRTVAGGTWCDADEVMAVTPVIGISRVRISVMKSLLHLMIEWCSNFGGSWVSIEPISKVSLNIHHGE